MRLRALFTAFGLYGVLQLSPALADTAGPFEPLRFENGISFVHPDARYQVNLRFRMQNLVEYVTRSESDLSASRIDAQVRRLRLRLSGWAADPRLTFQLQLSFTRQDMDWLNSQWPNIVRDANVGYAVTPRFQLAFGQAKLPGNRQRVVSSGELQFADRSIVNRFFNIDRDFGVQALWRLGALQDSTMAPTNDAAVLVRAAISTGEGRNLPFSSDSGLGYVGRIEWLPLGLFTGMNDYQEGDLAHEPNLKLSIALTGAQFRNSNRAGGTIGTIYTTTGNPNSGSPIRRDQQLLYADALAKYRGLSLYAEYARRWAHVPEISATQSLFVGRGALFQMGYLLGSVFEPVARVAWVGPDERARIDSANHRLTQTTLGVTRYFQGHRVKVQSDWTLQTGDIAQHLVRFNVELGI